MPGYALRVNTYGRVYIDYDLWKSKRSYLLCFILALDRKESTHLVESRSELLLARHARQAGRRRVSYLLVEGACGKSGLYLHFMWQTNHVNNGRIPVSPHGNFLLHVKHDRIISDGCCIRLWRTWVRNGIMQRATHSALLCADTPSSTSRKSTHTTHGLCPQFMW